MKQMIIAVFDLAVKRQCQLS